MSHIDNILKNIPSWLSDENNKNINAIINSVGFELSRVDELFDLFQKSLYLDSAHNSIPHMIYKYETGVKLSDYEFESNIEIVDSVYSFFIDDDYKLIVDYESNIIYINKKIDTEVYVVLYKKNYITGEKIEENKIKCAFKPHHIWNCFDEFAALFAIKRQIFENGEYEDNESLKNRIYNTINQKSLSSKNNVKNMIANDLNIDSSKVEIINISDIEEYDAQNNINVDLLRYIDLINEKYKYIKYNWDKKISNLSIKNLSYAPRLLFNGIDQIPSKFISNGIGDENDLKIDIDNNVSNEQQFNVDISIVGEKTIKTEHYPAVSMRVKAVANGKKITDYPDEKTFNAVFMGSEIVKDDAIVTAHKKYSVEKQVDLNQVELFNIEKKKTNDIYGFHKPYIITNIKLFSDNNRTNTPIVNSVTINYKTKSGITSNIQVDLSKATTNIDNQDKKLKLSKGTYSISFQSPITWQSFYINGAKISPVGIVMEKKK